MAKEQQRGPVGGVDGSALFVGKGTVPMRGQSDLLAADAVHAPAGGGEVMTVDAVLFGLGAGGCQQ